MVLVVVFIIILCNYQMNDAFILVHVSTWKCITRHIMSSGCLVDTSEALTKNGQETLDISKSVAKTSGTPDMYA